MLFIILLGYMTIQCAPACMTCEQLAFETRCPMPKELNNTWEPGSLNAMFDRIVNSTSTVTLRDDYPNLDASQKPYAVQVLKQPKKNAAADDEASTSDDALWVEDEPWVVIVDDFLTDHECDTLIELGGVQGYLQSKDVGEKKFDGTYGAHLSSGRTSTNAWCQEACFENNITQRVIAKIEALTGIPDANAEYLQLLKYEETQFYQQHHDYIEHHTERAQGVRILTVFLYLNDVEEGIESETKLI